MARLIIIFIYIGYILVSGQGGPVASPDKGSLVSGRVRVARIHIPTTFPTLSHRDPPPLSPQVNTGTGTSAESPLLPETTTPRPKNTPQTILQYNNPKT